MRALELIMDPMAWMAQQIASRAPEQVRDRFNPRPPGVIHKGSGTEAVLRLLQRNPDRWFSHSELVMRLGRSKGQTDWALVYLRQQGMVQAQEYERCGIKPALQYKLKREE